MSRRGTIFTYSVIRSGAAGFQERIPYLLALVEENRQVRMTQVEGYRDGSEVRIGEEVEFVAEDGKGNPVYRFIR